MASDTHRGLNGLATDAQQPFNFKENALGTNPLTNIPHGNIPNTPLASSTISFLLGCSFLFGVYTAVSDISNTARLLTYQLGCFIAAWAFFHWAEFAVTAGWNFEKCSVDCQSFSSRKEEKNLMDMKRISWIMARCTTLLMVQHCWSILSACISSLPANHGHMFPKSVCFSYQCSRAHLIY